MSTQFSELSNLLQEEILAFLISAPQTKLNHIHAHLRQCGLLSELDSHPEQNFFKQNFVIMNALFCLQQEVHAFGFSLIIESITIRLCEYQTNRVQSGDDKLSQYYLNSENYHVSESEIKSLLEHFYQRYLAATFLSHKEVNNAFTQLALPRTASFKQVKTAWYKIALEHHPDRTPNAELKKYRCSHQAYQILKQHFSGQRSEVGK